MIYCLFGDAAGFCPARFGVCSEVWRSAADTHLKLLSGPWSQCWQCFNWGCVCNIVHRRSVAVLCMLYKISYNSMHPLYGTYPDRAPVRVTRGALFGHWYSDVPPRCTTSRCRRSFIPPWVSLRNDLGAWPRIRCCGTGGFEEQGKCLSIGLAARFPFVSYCFPFLVFHSMSGAGVIRPIGCCYIIALFQPCIASLF